jgi:hypothetical protein
MGTRAMDNITEGSFNTAMGYHALQNITTGSQNIAIGVSAGVNFISGSNSNIIIGNNLGPSIGTVLSDCIVIGARVGGNSGVSMNPNNNGQCLIGGIYGKTTTSSTTSQVIISDNGQLGTVVSSRRYKDNITDLTIPVENILNMEPKQFTYKENGNADIGLIAEEVYELIPSIVSMSTLESGEEVCETVQYHKLPTLLLKVVKHQKEEIDSLKEQLQDYSIMKAEHTQLKSDFESLKQIVEQMAQQMATLTENST